MRAQPAWIIATLLSLGPLRGEAAACKCGPEATPRDALAAAPIVFDGVVDDRWMQARWVDPFGDGAFAAPLVHYRFRVVRAWKGGVGPVFLVTQGGGCQPTFRVGRRYVMYVYPDRLTGGHLSPMCGSSTPFPDAAAHVAAFGAPAVSHPPDVRPIATGQPFGRWLQALTVAGVVVHANHLRHPTWQFRTASIAPGLSLVSAMLAAACWASWRRRPRVSAALFAAAGLLAWGALIHAGAVLARDSWFAYVTSW